MPGHQTRSNLVFTGVSPQVLDLHCLVPFTAGHILHLIKGFFRTRSFKSSELMAQLHEWVPTLAQFTATQKSGMKQGLEGQTRAQRQGDFADNSLYFTHNL